MEFDITNPIMMQDASNVNAWEGLTFVALEDSTIKYTASSVTTAQYSTDLQTWTNADGVTIPLPRGKRLYFKGNLRDAQDEEDYAFFSMTGKVRAKGNIESMGIMRNFCYYMMFKGCTSLVSAPALPAVILTPKCYDSMFYGCTSLEKAPELPATQLAPNCYRNMFYGCTSLKAAPKLPAIRLTTNCYNSMFYGCTSLKVAPELPAKQLDLYCYYAMFYGCTSLEKAPELPATQLAANCYTAMFRRCISLEIAPELPATQLTANCYTAMFYGCVGLHQIKCMSIIDLGSMYSETWVSSVAPFGTFIKNAAATWENTFGDNAIPTGWMVETATE